MAEEEQKVNLTLHEKGSANRYMRKTTLLKKYILDKEILVMPGAFDSLSAKIIEKIGFKAVTIGGYALSATPTGETRRFIAHLNRDGKLYPPNRRGDRYPCLCRW